GQIGRVTDVVGTAGLSLGTTGHAGGGGIAHEIGWITRTRAALAARLALVATVDAVVGGIADQVRGIAQRAGAAELPQPATVRRATALPGGRIDARPPRRAAVEPTKGCVGRVARADPGALVACRIRWAAGGAAPTATDHRVFQTAPPHCALAAA